MSARKILFVWSGLSGYMGDCWRALAAMPGVALKVSVDLTERVYGGSFRPEDVLAGLDWSGALPTDWRPDVVFIVGWHNPLCRAAALRADWADVPKVLCFDMPWRRSLRCFAARFVLRSYLRRFRAAYVPGESTARYARFLGFRQIETGMYATDTNRFGAHVGGGGFLFVGRDVADKGTDVLRAAHARYSEASRRAGREPKPLQIVNGLSPSALGPVYAAADVFVLASRWEPWGVVLAEAAAAGLPIVCTDRCGARFEFVREGENGLIVPADDPDALAAALARAETLSGELGRRLAEPYSCTAWASRVARLADVVAGRPAR